METSSSSLLESSSRRTRTLGGGSSMDINAAGGISSGFDMSPLHGHQKSSTATGTGIHSSSSTGTSSSSQSSVAHSPQHQQRLSPANRQSPSSFQLRRSPFAHHRLVEEVEGDSGLSSSSSVQAPHSSLSESNSSSHVRTSSSSSDSQEVPMNQLAAAAEVSEEQWQEWQLLQLQGQEYQAAGNVDAALACYLRLVRGQWQHLGGPHSLQVAQQLVQVGQLLEEKQRQQRISGDQSGSGSTSKSDDSDLLEDARRQEQIIVNVYQTAQSIYAQHVLKHPWILFPEDPTTEEKEQADSAAWAMENGGGRVLPNLVPPTARQTPEGTIMVAQVVLRQLVPVLMEQKRFGECVDLLHECLESLSDGNSSDAVEGKEADPMDAVPLRGQEEKDEKEKTAGGRATSMFGIPSSNRIQAHLQLALGKAYMGMRRYTAATVCLVEAAAQYETSDNHDDNDDDNVHNGNGHEEEEEEICALLGRLEFLQRQQSSSLDEEDSDSWRKWADSSGSSSSSERIPSDTDAGGVRRLTEEEVSARVDLALLGGILAASEPESVTRMAEKHEEPDTTATLEHGYLPDSSSSLGRPRDDDDNESSTCFGSDLLTSDLDTATTAASLLDPLPVTDPSSPRRRHSSMLPVDPTLLQDEIDEVDLLQFEEDAQGARLLRYDPTDESGIVTTTTATSNASPLGQSLSTLLGDSSTKMSSASSRTSSQQSGSDDFEIGSRQRRGLRIPSPRGRSRKTSKKQLRRSRRDGFASLPEEDEEVDGFLLALDKVDKDNGTPRRRALSPDLLIEEEYHTSSDGPVPYITTHSRTLSEDVSEITFVIHDLNSSRETAGDWWWGVTAEGFGRWFPTHIVSPAFQAAEGFLSAKAIHSRANNKKAPLDFDSDDESTMVNEIEESGDVDVESSSTEPEDDQATHLGVASQKKSITNNLLMSSSREFEYKIQSQSGPRRPSASSSRQLGHRGGNDIESDIADLKNFITSKQQDAGNGGTFDGELADALFTLAVLQSRRGSVESAIVSAQQALLIQKSAGNMDDATRSLHFLADLHLHQKQYEESLTFYSETARIERKEYGYYSDKVAKTLNCIGTVRSLQKEFRLAMNSHKEALKILKEVHGEDLKHPLVSETLCQIGSVYYRERNSLSTIQAKKDDYGTFIETGMLEVIGRAHEDRGSYKLAIAFFEEKLQFLKSSGKEADSPEDIAATLNSLGMLSARAGLFVEAAEYYEGALSIQKEVGCDRVQLATARVLIASVGFQLGDWKHSLQELRTALEILHDELGENHETVAATLYQIGLVHSSMGGYDEAMTALEDALSIQTLLLGEEHPATLRTRRQIGNLYAVYESEIETAFEEFEEILTLQKQVHGERHPNVAETLHSIGCAYARKGDMTSALRTLEECYYMRVEFLGWDHPLQAATLHEIASIHLKRRRLKRAIHICENVISIYKESLGEKHVDLARIWTTKAACYIARGDFSAATKCFDEALPMAEEIAGKSHPVVADIYVQRGTIHLRKCQFDEARACIQQALEMYRNAKFDEDHPSIREAIKKMERIERDEMLCV